MSGLLVSVRDADEARTALDSGATLIDVKEPTNGPLGRADSVVIDEVIASVGERVPVSAAMGELRDGGESPVPSRLTYVKWGIAGVPSLAELGRAWRHQLDSRSSDGPTPVAVAYVDHERAGCPDPVAVAGLAVETFGMRVFLLDTWSKDGSTLLDWIETEKLAALVMGLMCSDVRVALAGSLGEQEIDCLLPLCPDWFAVRGAACVGGRAGRIDAGRVRSLAALIASR